MISLATTGLMCASTVFWSLPASILSGAAAATAIAFINSVASLGGFISPEMFDWFKSHYDLGAGLMAAGASLGMAGGIILLVLKK
jgi:ACS family tartrate transporter-like MFS transporter